MQNLSLDDGLTPRVTISAKRQSSAARPMPTHLHQPIIFIRQSSLIVIALEL
jgi:hypothetical protein